MRVYKKHTQKTACNYLIDSSVTDCFIVYCFEARYYRAPTFTSRDPLFEKYPSISPYAYCANNPVKYVDPTGGFPISAHRKLTKKALENTNLSKNAQKLIIRGVSSYADIKLASDNNVHLDNMSNYESIVEGYNAAIEKIGSGDYLEVGVGLHTVADFYSHSNYIELYREYIGNPKNFDIDKIPTFSEAMNDPKLSNFLKENGLRTGTYGGSKLGAIGNYLKDMFSTDPNSHGQMNLDFNLGKGKLPFNDSTTLNKAALHVAQKDIHKRVEKIE